MLISFTVRSILLFLTVNPGEIGERLVSFIFTSEKRDRYIEGSVFIMVLILMRPWKENTFGLSVLDCHYTEWHIVRFTIDSVLFKWKITSL